jgi:hypothetical protein
VFFSPFFSLFICPSVAITLPLPPSLYLKTHQINIGCSFPKLIRRPVHLIGRHGYLRQIEGHSFGDHMISGSVSITTLSVIEAFVVLCSVYLWLVWGNVPTSWLEWRGFKPGGGRRIFKNGKIQETSPPGGTLSCLTRVVNLLHFKEPQAPRGPLSKIIGHFPSKVSVESLRWADHSFKESCRL